LRFSGVARTAARLPWVAVVSITRSDRRLPRVVIAMVFVAITVAAPTAVRGTAFFVA
jgi:hypothetical protein